MCTEHTVHIAVLPDSSRLKETDRTPLKVKTYHLGPTIHVIPESPLASVLWHPLAHATSSTDCLVTVTAEAAVRVWEFDKLSNWSFDRPKLAIDLRKLADGGSCDQDFEPSQFGKRRGFSVDDFDMDVSSACFGGRGGDDEDAWASMTLWVAMRNGDIYALCPLLSSKWKPTSTTIPSLTTTAISRMASINEEDASVDERRAADQQYEWVQEIDNEEPQVHQSTSTLAQFEVRCRPENPSAIPRLQGPFSVFSEDDEMEIEVSDMYVFPAILDEEDLFGGEDDDSIHMQVGKPVPFTTICVATTENEVFVAIDLDGVTGQWLPKKGKSAFSVPSSEVKSLTLVDTVVLEGEKPNAGTNWPTFSTDLVNPYTLFVNNTRSLSSISVNDWVTQLSAELIGTQSVDSGMRIRLETRCQGPITVVDQLIECQETLDILSAPAVIDDESVGYLLLAPSVSCVYGVVFNRDYFDTSTLGAYTTEPTTSTPSRSNSQFVKGSGPLAETVPAREPYAPARVFYENQHVPIDSLRRKLPLHLRQAVSDRPMKLSPAMLEVMTFTHRIVGAQSSYLENAAAELFRRCLRLQQELQDQVRQMTQLAEKLQDMSSREEVDENGETIRKQSPEQRLHDAQEKQQKLVARYEALRRKVGKVGSAKRELSSREIAWIEEIEALGRNVNGSEEDRTKDETTLDHRFDMVCCSCSFRCTTSADFEANDFRNRSKPSPKRS